MPRPSLLPALPFLALAALPLFACDDAATAPQDDEIATVVPAGKADDFYSRSAQEYYVEGRTTITLDASWADKTEAQQLAEVQRLIPYKQVVIGWFLNTYLVDKDGDDAYGGFKALTKNGSYEDMDLRAVEGQPLTWSFTLRQEVGGQMDLIAALPGARSVGPDAYEFDLWIGKISNTEMQKLETDREWYRSSPWGSFDPSKVSDDKKTIQVLTIRPEPRSDDAWIDTNRLYADGKVTMGIHFGWDYHNAYHEKHSKAVYDFLVAKGFKSPVGSWADLRHDAGPLVGSFTYGGKPVQAEVSLFWGRSGDPDTNPDTTKGGLQLEADMFDSLANREVVIFSGHSGPFYGFALANWRTTSAGDVDDSELMEAELNVGTYQLIVAEGCDTYAIGHAFYLNPSKPGLEDLDVITTTSFSNAATAGTVIDTLTALMGGRWDKKAAPKTYGELLNELDANSTWFTTMYGVHGIDDNPTVHPFADPAKTCTTCKTNANCGEGMRCTVMGDGSRACTPQCTASRDCGAGFACRHTQASGTLSGKVCVPESLSCVKEIEAPKLVINELLADPANGAAGDVNGDGHRDASQDEFVEIVNVGGAEVDLSRWTISDAVGVRHQLPSGTVLAPGGALVVFGGGTPNLQVGTTLVQTATTGMLGLNNGGDRVRLADVDGNPVAEVAYGAEGGQDKALARAVDGDEAAAFVLGAPTPGTKADGSQF